ncbi:MAG: response regulator transcription factor [Defluviitaleaceae bacterium]|nr:response regulator transcription factor [Defluviitaleaceae bacterium]
MPIPTILIVEDDSNLLRGIAFAFEKDGYATHQAGSVAEARTHLARHPIDLVILDVGLPDGSGIDLCKTIRQTSAVPIIMLTACDMETDEVLGFAAGADDYVTKPFSLSVLRARVEAVLRRLQTPPQHAGAGALTLDTGLCKLFKNNQEIPVSATEFKLLGFFMNHAGQVLSKDQILAALWDNQGNFVDENTLPVNISRLRAKIEDDPKNPRFIKTVHGMGYVFSQGGKA